MSPQIKIRKAKAGDESGIHQSHMRSINEICIKDHGVDEVRGWGNRALGNRWVEEIKSGFVWVVTSDEKILGHGFIRFEESGGEEIGFIKGLYLTPELLGKGLGRRLAEIMLDTARVKGVRRVALYSTITAKKFYEHLGFKNSAPCRSFDVGGYPVTCFPMELILRD